ncbi:dienelactone hydrolase family protein [uncultured Roseobacter sp.]|uniref:dienelactone hydrolase family protein n=1 Tax=uncultured Roseobacter sp. TaxID=114847 RepID=UPI00261FDF09|nr:dienelactone hydrolase family protein [uncultured Roseobacter sp.]
MTLETLQIETPDGVMLTYVGRPDGESRGNVLIYMDAMGIRDELLDGFLERYRAAGFTTFLPDLYYRFGENVSFDATVSYSQLPKDVQPVFYATVKKMRNDAPIVRDTGLLIDAVGAATGTDQTNLWSTVGYCMGGRFVVRSMAAYPKQFAAGVAVYPTGLVTDEKDAPVHDIAQISGKLFIGFGGADELTPLDDIDAVKQALEAADPEHDVHVYPDAGHAFMMPGKPSSYRHEASEDVWTQSLEMFGKLETT